MTKREATRLARRATRDGWTVKGYRRYGRGSWALDLTDPKTGIGTTVHTVEGYRA